MLVVLIPILGATGAAITTTVTYGVTTIVMLLGLRRSTRDGGATPRPPSE